jgi:hypothetical protein
MRGYFGWLAASMPPLDAVELDDPALAGQAGVEARR